MTSQWLCRIQELSEMQSIHLADHTLRVFTNLNGEKTKNPRIQYTLHRTFHGGFFEGQKWIVCEPGNPDVLSTNLCPLQFQGKKKPCDFRVWTGDLTVV